MRRAALIAAFVISLFTLAGCERESNNDWQGYVEGEYVLLASPYAGQLQKLHVRRGDALDAGKPVFALEQASERAARAEAEERLRASEEQYRAIFNATDDVFARMDDNGVCYASARVEAGR